jgi:hypothetical protein
MSLSWGCACTRQKAERWTRIVGNDMENIPLGLILSWLSLEIGKSKDVHTGLVVTFAACRSVQRHAALFMFFVHFRHNRWSSLCAGELSSQRGSDSRRRVQG